MSLDSFMNKAFNVVNLLSLALGSESASRRQIILSLTAYIVAGRHLGYQPGRRIAGPAVIKAVDVA